MHSSITEEKVKLFWFKMETRPKLILGIATNINYRDNDTFKLHWENNLILNLITRVVTNFKHLL